ncbi:hypothetical protein ACH5RR_012711, partial [Cinchona calisaya]
YFLYSQIFKDATCWIGDVTSIRLKTTPTLIHLWTGKEASLLAKSRRTLQFESGDIVLTFCHEAISSMNTQFDNFFCFTFL